MCKEIHLSVVVPVFNSSPTLVELHRRIKDAISGFTSSYEVILVDDGSIDESWETVSQLSDDCRSTVGIRLSRNFGQSSAILAGTEESSGDWVIVMDSDLQDPPEEIPRLYERAVQGWDLVVARRKGRKDSYFRKISSYTFFKFFSLLSDIAITPGTGNFGIYSRQVIIEISRAMKGDQTFGSAAAWVGFLRSEIWTAHNGRIQGRSNYSVRALVSLSVKSILVNSSRPLWAIFVAGTAVFLASSIYGIGGGSIVGFADLKAFTPNLIVGLLGGAILSSIGIVGLYFSSIRAELSQKPRYVVADRKASG